MCRVTDRGKGNASLGPGYRQGGRSYPRQRMSVNADLSHNGTSRLCWYNGEPLRRLRPIVFLCALAAIAGGAQRAGAQQPPPIPLYVVDLHGIVINFPANDSLAMSRGLSLSELPGRGLGGDVAIHVYPFKYRSVTFGIGGRAVTSRAHRLPTQASGLRAVTERFTYLAPQLSFNFGTGAGWSYISGGLAGARWSVVPDGALPQPPDQERLLTIDYGGGARWFAKPHVAFSFDVRFYAINPSSPTFSLPSGPRSRLFVFGAGISVK
jgi:hypothetical protein